MTIFVVARSRHVRPRIQRAFLAWYGANRPRFSVRLHLNSRTDKSLSAKFVGLTPSISMNLHHAGLDVSVEHDGQWLDMLLSLDAITRAVPGGYICTMCEPAERQIFASREAIWIDHLFEPFLQWVNDRLAPARWLEIITLDGGSVATALMASGDELRPAGAALPAVADAETSSGTSLRMAVKVEAIRVDEARS